jgi:hypothetical protein|tara:strand:- start:806 stop:1339 length:534 start_codon:yes stop_codon:yes gene_type:complete
MNRKLIGTLALTTLTIAGFGLSSCKKESKTNSDKDTRPTQNEKSADEVLPQTPGQTPTNTTADAGKLKPIMANLGTEMNTLQSALWLEDYEIIATSAMKIAEHPKVSDAEKVRVKTAMGEDMGAFVAMDKMVHDGAVALSEAATSNDMPKTLNALAALQRNCVACHSTFRSRLTETK